MMDFNAFCRLHKVSRFERRELVAKLVSMRVHALLMVLQP